MATVAIVVLIFMTPGIVLGTASSWRVGHAPAHILHSARYWLVAWLCLVCISVLL